MLPTTQTVILKIPHIITWSSNKAPKSAISITKPKLWTLFSPSSVDSLPLLYQFRISWSAGIKNSTTRDLYLNSHLLLLVKLLVCLHRVNNKLVNKCSTRFRSRSHIESHCVNGLNRASVLTVVVALQWVKKPISSTKCTMKVTEDFAKKQICWAWWKKSVSAISWLTCNSDQVRSN